MPGAYSPKTGLMYMPLENLCSVVTSAGPKTGKGQLGMKIDYTAKLAPGETNVGQVRAVSVKTGCDCVELQPACRHDGRRRHGRRSDIRR